MLSAQDSLRLDIICLDKNNNFLKKNISYNNENHSPVSLIQELNQVLLQLHDKGYLAASVALLFRQAFSLS